MLNFSVYSVLFTRHGCHMYISVGRLFICLHTYLSIEHGHMYSTAGLDPCPHINSIVPNEERDIPELRIIILGAGQALPKLRVIFVLQPGFEGYSQGIIANPRLK